MGTSGRDSRATTLQAGTRASTKPTRLCVRTVSSKAVWERDPGDNGLTPQFNSRMCSKHLKINEGIGGRVAGETAAPGFPHSAISVPQVAELWGPD